jgi:guanylate kinase
VSTLHARSAPIVLSAPSGAGKTTIAKRLVGALDHFTFSVSATTRAPRAGEVDGKDYHFVSPEQFQAMIDGDELLEWADVHGERYGTPRAYVEDAARSGNHVMLDIDVQGALQVLDRADDPILIFILPPSIEVLLERLRRRGTENREQLARRLKNARDEIAEASKFHYVVVNDDIDESVAAVRTIAAAHRFRIGAAQDLSSRLKDLLGGLDRVLSADFASHEP